VEIWATCAISCSKVNAVVNFLPQLLNVLRIAVDNSECLTFYHEQPELDPFRYPTPTAILPKSLVVQYRPMKSVTTPELGAVFTLPGADHPPDQKTPSWQAATSNETPGPLRRRSITASS
jgi:hypothetical protein